MDIVRPGMGAAATAGRAQKGKSNRRRRAGPRRIAVEPPGNLEQSRFVSLRAQLGLVGALILVLLGQPAQAGLQVAASSNNMAMLARTIGGCQVRVTVLAPAARDLQWVQAAPAMHGPLRLAAL